MEKFLEWIKVKIKLHTKARKPPFVSEGEIWWVSLGENIGTEINGKGALFTRPVIILKKLSREIYLIVPVSTQIHTGTWYVPYRQRNINAVACLQQIRTIDYHRFFSKLGEMSENDFMEIKRGFQNLYNFENFLRN